MELAIRAQVTDAYPALLAKVQQPDAAGELLVGMLRLLQAIGDGQASAAALGLVSRDRAESEILAAIDVIDSNGSESEVQTLLPVYHDFSPAVRNRLRDLFFGRAGPTKSFLKEVERGNVAADEVPLSQLSQLASHHDIEIDRLVREQWGRIGRGSSEETLATMRRLSNDLRAGTGDLDSGKLLFTKHCATCHQLHGEGNRVGPDLTTANRQDQAALLSNIVDPSAVIRREYESYVVQTDAGRTLTGLLAEQDAAAVTLLDAQNRRLKIPRDEIEAITPSEISLMPERLHQQLSPQQLRDLFSYLEK
jgi:putative heme-binding domain-containing protein